jgi:hypothetical protein
MTLDRLGIGNSTFSSATRVRLIGDLDEQDRACPSSHSLRRTKTLLDEALDQARQAEYCGSSICFSSSTGRNAPHGARANSSSASYQDNGGKPAFFKSCSTAPSTLALNPHQGGSRRKSPRARAFDAS